METYETYGFSHLTNNQVAQLYATTKAADAKAEAVKRFEAVVYSCTSRYVGRTDYEDMVQEGRLALLQALEVFNPELARFSTIAVNYVNGKVRNYLRDRASFVRVPAWVQEHYKKENMAVFTLTAAFGRPPTLNEVAEIMGVGVEKLRQMHQDNPYGVATESLSRYDESNVDGNKRLHASMLTDIFGNHDSADDGLFMDHEEKMYAQQSTVSELMHAHNIGAFDARKIKEIASR